MVMFMKIKKKRYFNFSNDKDNPTLRLDVTYDNNNKIIQYVSKEYGFTENILSTTKKRSNRCYQTCTRDSNKPTVTTY